MGTGMSLIMTELVSILGMAYTERLVTEIVGKGKSKVYLEILY